MPRPKNFPGQRQARVSWNISKVAADKLRLAALQLGMTPAAVMDRLILRGLHLVLDGNQVGGDAPAPRKEPAPASAGSPKIGKPSRKPRGTAEPGATEWTPETLQEALDQLRRKRPELQALIFKPDGITPLSNIDVWWSPPKHKKVPPAVPRKHWARIDSILAEWGWVKPV